MPSAVLSFPCARTFASLRCGGNRSVDWEQVAHGAALASVPLALWTPLRAGVHPRVERLLDPSPLGQPPVDGLPVFVLDAADPRRRRRARSRRQGPRHRPLRARAAPSARVLQVDRRTQLRPVSEMSSGDADARHARGPARLSDVSRSSRSPTGPGPSDRQAVAPPPPEPPPDDGGRAGTRRRRPDDRRPSRLAEPDTARGAGRRGRSLRTAGAPSPGMEEGDRHRPVGRASRQAEAASDRAGPPAEGDELGPPAKREVEKDEGDQEEDEPADAHEPRSRDGARPPRLEPRQRGDRGDEHCQAKPEHPAHGGMISLPGAARGRNGVAIPCDIVAA